jgi:hypothetical protein
MALAFERVGRQAIRPIRKLIEYGALSVIHYDTAALFNHCRLVWQGCGHLQALD